MKNPLLIALLLSTTFPLAALADEPDYPPKLPGGKTVVTHTDEAFLKPHAGIQANVQIADEAPTIDFLYYPEQTYPGEPWSVWGDSLAVNGKYYSAIGDHKKPQGNAFVYEYDPETKEIKTIVNLKKLLDLPEGHYMPGKIHSRIDMGSDGWLYFATHRGGTRVTTDEYHYKGDWIVRHHPESGKTEIVKHAPVATFPPDEAAHVFKSSGTGRSVPSTHHVKSLDLYERVFSDHFADAVGSGPFTFVAHLPHYAERGETSSLLYMVEGLIERFGDSASGFFLDDTTPLHEAIAHSQDQGARFLLFGAAFGLLDLIERGSVELLADALVIETGGMKTYRQSVTRDELHQRLRDGLGVPESQVWSEYGMCELMSQCYTRGDRIFYPPPWMRFRVVDPEQPTEEVPEGSPGALALFDLANLFTVSALMTQDRAVRRGDGFEVLGRLSDAELRGCNFLLESEA